MHSRILVIHRMRIGGFVATSDPTRSASSG
jgi:hypothetical protein